MSNPEERKFLRPQDIAARLDVAADTVNMWMVSGELPFIEIAGERFVLMPAFERFVERRDTGVTIEEQAERYIGPGFDGDADVAAVWQRLDRIWERKVGEIWLISPNAHLDGDTPRQVLDEGRLDDVLRAIDAEEQGAYAVPRTLEEQRADYRRMLDARSLKLHGKTMEELAAEGPDVGDMTESEMDDLSN